jgi:NAD(P)-dependent dehydrogenase (short-subunit alcohol dehydrogenase family)
MTPLRDKSAVVIGGSSGLGEGTVKALIFEGVRLTAVARGADRPGKLEANVGEGLSKLQGDASFLLIKQVLSLPLSPGSTLVVVLNGAAMLWLAALRRLR